MGTRTTLITILALIIPSLVYGQADEVVDAEGRSESDLNVYVDCDYCDTNYVRENVRFVNYVRDQAQADVHVQVVNRRTGGGGDQFEFRFLGRNEFDGDDLELKFYSDSDASWDDVRIVWTQKFMAGLVYYLSQDPQSGGFTITSSRPRDNSISEQVDDKWNYWVFDIDARRIGNSILNSTTIAIHNRLIRTMG